MSEFWESVFKNNDKMWGENPTDNAKHVVKMFLKHNINSVLIPGFGYGRNAKVFYDEGIRVTGIEISKSAIDRAYSYFGNDVTIHHGSVKNMPFDKKQYDSIYCYSLLHLLDMEDRKKLIKDCYSQLNTNGMMVFVALSVSDKRFGNGDLLKKNTFLSPHGLSLYFYDEISVKRRVSRL